MSMERKSYLSPLSLFFLSVLKTQLVQEKQRNRVALGKKVSYHRIYLNVCKAPVL